MSELAEACRENPFENDNAKTASRQDLVSTFVPTKHFVRLLSRKNHIVLGARGSGKTALAKMLSHDHLAPFAESAGYEPAVKAIADRAFIGIYVATDLEWVGALKNKLNRPGIVGVSTV